MRKGQIYEADVVRCDYPGKGIALVNEREVGIRGALPGQKIAFRLTRKTSSRCEGLLLDVKERAQAERESDCPHFPDCGGCLYRTLPYEEELRMKEEQIRRLMDGTVLSDRPWFEGIHGSPDYTGYRNKMEFTFGDAYKGGPLSLGMHKSGSFYDIVCTQNCRIVDEDFRKILSAVLNYAQGTKLPYFHRLTHQGYFRHLLIRKAVYTGEILVDLVTTSQADPDLQAFTEAVLSAVPDGKGGSSSGGRIAGILHTVNDSVADTIHNDRTEILMGRDFFYEKLLGLSFKITPFSFFQTNSRGAEVLYSLVRDYIGSTKDKVVFDLYSGTGTIAQILAPVAKHVTGVEIVPEAVEAARENALQNGLDNCSFICGDVLKMIDELTERPDLIILDPPREGIHPKAMPKILAFGVERIVYVSCKASSLKRDLHLLQAAGYRVERMSLVDMFPGTGHIETIVLLQKLNS
jgi:23S rRNA (uracil-5-)-methyltransferase RumA